MNEYSVVMLCGNVAAPSFPAELLIVRKDLAVSFEKGREGIRLKLTT